MANNIMGVEHRDYFMGWLRLTGDNRGVSKVVGVVLLVGMTILLAVSIGSVTVDTTDRLNDSRISDAESLESLGPTDGESNGDERTTGDDSDSTESGSSGSEASPSNFAGNTWNQFGTDATNDGNVKTEGVSSPVSEQWAFTPSYHDVETAPVVANETLYMVVENFDSRIAAVDPQTGTEEWSVSVDAHRGAPAVADGTLYYSGRDTVYAVDADTGTEQWNFSVPDGGGTNPVNTPPTVVDGTVYVGADVGSYPFDGRLYALDATTGSEQWNVTRTASITAPPAVADGTAHIFAGGTVSAVDTESGETEWTTELKGAGYVLRDHHAVVRDQTVYAATRSGDFTHAYALNADTGEIRWNVTKEGTPSAPAVANGTVYLPIDEPDGIGVDPSLHALDAETGATDWTSTYGGTYSPAVVNGTVYVDGSGDRVYAVDGETGALQWSFRTHFTVRATPVVFNGTVYAHSTELGSGSLQAIEGS